MSSPFQTARAEAAKMTSMAEQPLPGTAKPGEVEELEKRLSSVNDESTLMQIAEGFHGRGQLELEAATWKRLTQLLPHIGQYKLNMATDYAQLDRKSECYTALLELQKQGYAYQIENDPRFAKVATTEAWNYILTGFDVNRKPFGAGGVAYTLPREDLLIESLAWDPTRKAMLVGSARKGAVYQVRRDGKLKPLIKADKENGMWAVFDLVVDAKRNRLWVASTAVPHFEGYSPETDLGRAGIFEFQLDNGKFVNRYLSPSLPGQSFFLSTLALGKDGEVYAADGVNNALYRVRDGSFKRMFHAPRLSSIRGMAVSDDGTRLYFADHQRGVLGVDLTTGKPFDVLVPKELALGGIDGMVWWKDSLIVVQNSMEPNRVMRIVLDGTGHSVANVVPLEAGQPSMTLPTHITRDGKTLYLIANSQQGNYDRFGLLKDKSALDSVRIYSLQADFTPPPMDITPFLEFNKGHKPVN